MIYPNSVPQALKSAFSLSILCLIFACLLSGCWPPAHKIDVNQGNLLEQSAIQQIEVGMTKAQVQYLIGSPILENPFNTQQWDYLYLAQPGGKAPERKLLSIHFDGDLVSRISGDMLDQRSE